MVLDSSVRMNNNEILNKYIDLIDKGYCCDCNELNCIDNFPQAKITHAIRKLQQENKQLKEKLDKYENPEDMTLFAMWCTEKVKEENKRLKDNWDELKEYLNYKSERAVGEDEYVYDEIYNEMQEMEKNYGNVEDNT